MYRYGCWLYTCARLLLVNISSGLRKRIWLFVRIEEDMAGHGARLQDCKTARLQGCKTARSKAHFSILAAL